MRRPPISDVPDVLLPLQFFDRGSVSDTPEKRLMVAVLLDAITQLQRSGADDAERWIRDELDDVAITFAEACEVLGIEARKLARGLLSWRDLSAEMPRARSRRLPGSRRRVTPVGPLGPRRALSLKALESPAPPRSIPRPRS